MLNIWIETNPNGFFRVFRGSLLSVEDLASFFFQIWGCPVSWRSSCFRTCDLCGVLNAKIPQTVGFFWLETPKRLETCDLWTFLCWELSQGGIVRGRAKVGNMLERTRKSEASIFSKGLVDLHLSKLRLNHFLEVGSWYSPVDLVTLVGWLTSH